LTVAVTAADSVALEVEGDATGDAVQPTTERRRLADRGGFTGQDQKRGLASVLGIVAVGECSATDAEHHRAVPFDQHGERGLVVAVANRSNSSTSPSPRRLAPRQLEDGPQHAVA
jgi:hypothetical protein